MSLFAKVGNAIDQAMGTPESAEGCTPDNPQALALVEAGLKLLDSDTTVSAESLLSDFGTAQALQNQLGNLDKLSLDDPTSTLGQVIINGGTVSDLMAILDPAKVDYAVNQLVALEKQQARSTTEAELDSLRKDIV